MLLADEKYSFISVGDKEFITAFADAMARLGYTYGSRIADGICWGKYMLVFTKENVSSKKAYARIYIRDDSIVLRLFLNNVTAHSGYIVNAPDFIRESFTGSHGSCQHCKGDDCRFRKDYVIADVTYEKCNGVTFEFFNPELKNLEEYIGLFTEFYPVKKIKGGHKNERKT